MSEVTFTLKKNEKVTITVINEPDQLIPLEDTTRPYYSPDTARLDAMHIVDQWIRSSSIGDKLDKLSQLENEFFYKDTKSLQSYLIAVLDRLEGLTQRIIIGENITNVNVR